MLTVWFPLMDTDAENGCLQVIPGSHRGEVLTHCGGVQGLNIPSTILPGEDTARGRPAARRRLPLPAPQDDPRRPAQPQRAHPLELRPALPPARSADRPRGLPGLHRPQPKRPRRGSVGRVELASDVARCPLSPRRPTRPRIQPLGPRRRCLRLAICLSRPSARRRQSRYNVDTTQRRRIASRRGRATSEQGDSNPQSPQLEKAGWRIELARGHAWAKALCPETSPDGCTTWIYSTPSNVRGHVRKLERALKNCPHTVEKD